MRGPKFDSSEDGKDALATVHGISRALIDKLFDKTDEVAPKPLEEYSVEDEVDIDVLREYLKIAFCEDIAWMADQGVWDGDEDVKRIVNEMDEDAGANTKMMVGRVASRHRNVMRLNGAIMQETFSSEQATRTCLSDRRSTGGLRIRGAKVTSMASHSATRFELAQSRVLGSELQLVSPSQFEEC